MEDERVDVNKTDQHGLNPLDNLFLNYNNNDKNLLELVKILLERGVNVNSNLLLTVCGNRQIKENLVEMVKLLIEKGCDANATNRDGWTPLVRLFRSYDGNDGLLITLFTILVENRGDVTVKTADGRNLLHHFFSRDPRTQFK